MRRFILSERERWDAWKLRCAQYMRAYENCLSATSTHYAPWHVISADDKQNARLIISQITGDTLNGLKLTFPEVDPARRQEVAAGARPLNLRSAPTPIYFALKLTFPQSFIKPSTSPYFTAPGTKSGSQ